MKYEKGLRFKLAILKKYGLNIRKYKINKEIREFYLQRCEMGKSGNTEKYFEILSFIGKKEIDFERFYYIYFELAYELYKLKRYDEACKYYQIAIDNVISPSYKKNISKLKSKHYEPFMKCYCFAVDCFLKAARFDDADYYYELNMYRKNITEMSDRFKADVYIELGGKDVAAKYLEKIIHKIDSEVITRHYDYDPYTNGYLEEEYNRQVAEKEKRISIILDEINSL